MAVRDVREVFARMPEAFDGDAAKGLDAVLQFEITEDQGGSWHVIIKDGRCAVLEGSHAGPTVRVTMSSETWLAIVNKDLSGIQAFMSGKLNVKGEILLAQRIPDLFPFV